MIYLYDGRLDGFLTCIYHHYYSEPCAQIIEEQFFEGALFEPYKKIVTDEGLAKKVHDGIKKKFTDEMYTNLYHAFLAHDPERETHLLHYIELAFKIGSKIDRIHTDDAVYRVKQLSRQVGFERHRFLGLLRFSDMGTYLYATFEPDNNIIELLGDHFVDRLALERFIIHDVKRCMALVAQKGSWVLTNLEITNDMMFSEEELFFQKLWQTYFDTIGIEGRKNPRLQQQFVPLKYRGHIHEFKN